MHIIKPHRFTTITLSKLQGEKISKICTEINKANAYTRDKAKENKASKRFKKQLRKDDMYKSLYLPPLDPSDITQPITINDMPGLLCKQQKGNKYVRVTIPNVSATAIKLQQTLHIKPRQPPKFHTAKIVQDNNTLEQTVMQIGPKMDNNTILTINEAGKVRRLHQDNLTQTEKDTLSYIHRQF